MFFRARMLKAGYVTAIAALVGLYLTSLFATQYVGLLLPIVLTVSLLVPAVIYHRLDRLRKPMGEVRIGNRLKQWRAKKELTQADLANVAGVSRKTINTVENGVFVPSVFLALVLARELGTTVESLFYLTHEWLIAHKIRACASRRTSVLF